MWEWEIDMRIQVPIVRWNLYLYPSVSISMVKKSALSSRLHLIYRVIQLSDPFHAAHSALRPSEKACTMTKNPFEILFDIALEKKGLTSPLNFSLLH